MGTRADRSSGAGGRSGGVRVVGGEGRGRRVRRRGDGGTATPAGRARGDGTTRRMRFGKNSRASAGRRTMRSGKPRARIGRRTRRRSASGRRLACWEAGRCERVGGGGARETRDDGVGVEGGRGGEEAHARGAGTRGGGTETKIGRVAREGRGVARGVEARRSRARKKPSAARSLVEYRSKWDKLLRAAAEEKRANCARSDFPIRGKSKMTPRRRHRDFLTTRRASRRAPRETSRGVVALRIQISFRVFLAVSRG